MPNKDLYRVVWDPLHVEPITRARVTEAMLAQGQALLEKANVTVPRDRNNLAESGVVRVDARGRVQVAYESPYAIYEHEDREYHHQGLGRAKWLELALQENREETGAAIAAAAGLGFVPA